MTNMPQISIIVTAYNIEKYIAESLSSITEQTIRDIEIIIVDDGSTDATPQIIRDFAARDPRIKAVGFTGSRAGGTALMQTAATRPEVKPPNRE